MKAAVGGAQQAVGVGGIAGNHHLQAGHVGKPRFQALRVLRPGVQVTPDTVVLELSDPNVQQALNDAEQQQGFDLIPKGSQKSRSSLPLSATNCAPP